MRLRDYQYLLDQCINLLNNLSGQIIRNNSNRGMQNDFKVIGLKSFNKAIKLLREHHLFENKLKELDAIKYIDRASDDIVILQNEYNNLKSIRDNIITQAQNLKATIDNILPEEDDNSLNLKIPEDISTISELNDFISNLDLIFHIYKEFNCEVNFKGVETGSSWITVLIGTALAAKPCINFLFDIAKKGLELRNLKLDGDRKILEIEELKGKLEEQDFQKVINARKAENEEKYDQLKYKYAEESISVLKTLKDNLSNENEVIEKAKMAIEKIGELIDNGMEVKLAYNASEEIKTILAQYNEKLEEHKQFVIGVNKQKLIEKKDIEEDKNNEEHINDEE